MRRTHHAARRQRQRHIPDAVVELAVAEGLPLSRNSDRVLLNSRRVEELRHDGSVDRTLLARAAKAVPFVCVVVGDTLVTTFRATRAINRGR